MHSGGVFRPVVIGFTPACSDRDGFMADGLRITHKHTIHWPPNSPDLTVMDSSFSGYLKGKFDREVDELTVPRVKDINYYK